MVPAATLNLVVKGLRNSAPSTPIGPELPAASVTVTPSPGINCPLGVKRRIFGVGRDHVPAIAGLIVGSALAGLSAVENWNSIFAEKLTFEAPSVGVALVTRKSGRFLLATALPPLLFRVAGEDAGVCALARRVAAITPPPARMTMRTAAMTMECPRSRAMLLLVTAPDRLF
jgi:hypothetical protein